MKRIQCSALVVLAALSLAAAACGRTADNRTAAMQTATPVIAEMGSARWQTASGASVAEMLKALPIVFVGRVDSVAQRSVPVYPADTDFSGPTVEGKPHISAPGPTVPVSDYSIMVLTPIRGGLSAGETVTLSMGGGDVRQPDGQLRRWVIEGDRLLEIGQTYLLFTFMRDDVLRSAPWGKFKITDDMVEPLSDEWASLGVVRQLSGKLTSMAAQEIASPTGD